MRLRQVSLSRFLLFSFFLFLKAASITFGQPDSALPRGDIGRTGTFKTSGLRSATTVAWKSSQIYSFYQFGDRSSSVHAKVLGDDTIVSHPFPTSGFPYTLSYITLDLFEETAPLFFNDNIFFTLNFEDSYLISLDAKTGNVNWSYKVKNKRLSKPVIHRNILFLLSGDRKIRALNIKTGKEIWVHNTTDSWIQTLTPTALDGVLFFIGSTSDNKLYAFDIEKKTTRWVFKAKGVLTIPAFGNDTAYVGTNKDYLYAIDVKSGNTLWKFKAKAGSPVVSNNMVFFNDDEYLYSVDAKSGELKWREKAEGRVGTFLAFYDSTIFYGGKTKNYYAIDAVTGKTKWVVKTKYFCNEPVIANDIVFSGCDEKFLMLKANTGEMIDEIKVGKNWASSPALSDGILFFRNNDGYVFAVK